jgi:predicted enzyme related to lactoylglutathione lyase
MKIIHSNIFTNNKELSQEFYSSVFGSDLLDASCDHSFYFELVDKTAENPEDPLQTVDFVFEVDDFSALRDRLNSAGIEIIEQGHLFPTLFLIISDPNGKRLGFLQSVQGFCKEVNNGIPPKKKSWFRLLSGLFKKIWTMKTLNSKNRRL